MLRPMPHHVPMPMPPQTQQHSHSQQQAHHALTLYNASPENLLVISGPSCPSSWEEEAIWNQRARAAVGAT